MKQFLILVTIALTCTTSLAQKVDSSFVRRIEKACNMSPDSSDKKIDSKAFCSCLAKAHYEYALKRSSGAKGIQHLEWVEGLYKIQDEDRSQKYYDADPVKSEIDSQIAATCEAKQK